MSAAGVTKLDGPCLERALGGMRHRIARLHLFDTVDSTNNFLLAEPAPANGDCVVALAARQSAGRGRLGKRWETPDGAGLCLSVARSFPRAPTHPGNLTLAAGVAVVEALEALGANGVALKWPNDLIAAGKKLGGILVESRPDYSPGQSVVVGIGINRRLPDDFSLPPDENPLPPTDLASVVGEDRLPTIERLAASVVNQLVDAFDAFESDGLAAFRERWQALDYLRGRSVEASLGTRRVRGEAAGIAAAGELRVRDPNGQVWSIDSGSVRVVESGLLP